MHTDTHKPTYHKPPIVSRPAVSGVVSKATCGVVVLQRRSGPDGFSLSDRPAPLSHALLC